MARTGRPPKISPALIDKICEVIRSGSYIEQAAGFVGVDRSTLFRWIAKGKAQKTGIYRDFCAAVEKARDTSEVAAVAVVRSAMPNHWQAAAWYLERTNRERWGRRTQITGPGDGPLRVDVSSGDLLAKLKRLAGAEEDDAEGPAADG